MSFDIEDIPDIESAGRLSRRASADSGSRTPTRYDQPQRFSHLSGCRSPCGSLTDSRRGLPQQLRHRRLGEFRRKLLDALQLRGF